MSSQSPLEANQNPLLDDNLETCAMNIRSLLAVAQSICAGPEQLSDLHFQEAADRMYGAELAIQMARQAVTWLGNQQFNRSLPVREVKS